MEAPEPVVNISQPEVAAAEASEVVKDVAEE